MSQRPRGRVSAGEAMLAFHIKAMGIPEPVREYKFHLDRRWRFDFSWPEHLVACEVEGGVWTNGRHVRGRGYTDDCEKYSAAAVLGWRVIRVTPEHIRSGKAVQWILQALGLADDTRR